MTIDYRLLTTDYPKPRGRTPFWESKSLEELAPAQWEALCDGCGKCCLHKVQYTQTGRVYYTDVACRLLDVHRCRCLAYSRRNRLVKGCLRLDPAAVRRLKWLPSTCAYRRLAEGKGLAWWHPLVSRDPETVHTAHVSVRGKVVPEHRVDTERLEEHIIEWDLWDDGQTGRRRRKMPR